MLQAHHIHFNTTKRLWRLHGAEDKLEDAEAHAAHQQRLFVPYLQRTEPMWDALTWTTTLADAERLARMGLAIVPLQLPLSATLREWQQQKPNALAFLRPTQRLMPVVSTYHEPAALLPILAQEFRDSALLGVHHFSINGATTRANLATLHELTYRTPLDTAVPLVVGFCAPRYFRSLANVSAAFELELYGVDILSYLVVSPAQAAHIEDSTLATLKFYDRQEGAYTDTPTQVAWYGHSLTRVRLQAIAASEGLDPYYANRWADYLAESEEMDLFNQAILQGRAVAFASPKSRWQVELDAYLLNFQRRHPPTTKP